MRFLLLPVLMLSALGAAPVSAEVIECAIRQQAANGGWFSPTVAVNHEEGAATAVVNDAIILAVMGKPVEAKVETDNAKRTTYSWVVMGRDISAQNAKMIYRLTVMKADLSARMKMIPAGYANNFDAGGQCRKVKG